MLFDTHAHYDDIKFDNGREKLIQDVKNCGYIKYVLNVSAVLSSIKKTLSLTQHFDFIYGAVGIHPEGIHEIASNNISEIADIALSSKKIVAIGEIGLDYHYHNHNKDAQKKWFIQQIDMAKQIHLPIIVHDRDAHQDTLDIIKNENASTVGGVFHCYSGSKDMLREVLNSNFLISIGGVVTFKNAKTVVDVVKYVPEDCLLLETDCPYLAPEPHRGKRNDSRYLNLIAQRIADIKGVNMEEIASITTSNAQKLFKIY